MTWWRGSEVPSHALATENGVFAGGVVAQPDSLLRENEVITGNGDSWANFKDLAGDNQVEHAGLLQSVKAKSLRHSDYCESNVEPVKSEVAPVDDWQDFNDKSSDNTTLWRLGDSGHTFRYCFPVVSASYSGLTSNSCIFCEQSLLLSRLLDRRRSLSMETMPCRLISTKFKELVLSHSKENSPNSKAKSHLNLDLPAECNDFDWNVAKEPVELDDMSPIVFKPTQPDSPIGLDFDQGRAVVGLAVLSEEELKKMIREMESKFAHRSEALINDLTLRDKLVYELSVKNKFISAMLQVQALRHSNSLPTSASRLESVGRALTSKPKSVEERSNVHFLSLVIPYNPPENHQWKLTILRNITEILNAIAEGSDSVPKLLADYIQGEVLQRDCDDRQWIG